jgi:hypothetical protein
MVADLFDALSWNTRVTWGPKAPKIPGYPRPKSEDPEAKKKPKTVKDLFKKFTAGKH